MIEHVFNLLFDWPHHDVRLGTCAALCVTGRVRSGVGGYCATGHVYNQSIII